MTKSYNRRREFLKRSAHAALLGASGMAMGGKMSLMGSAMAAQGDYGSLPGYKALVCVFLYGGSDSFNLYIPSDDALFRDYTASRGSLALPRSSLESGRSRPVYFHPNLGGLRSQYDAGNLAVVRNVGNMLAPIDTVRDFEKNPNLAPADLFAHNSQQEQVLKGHSSRPVGLVGAGWGGRMADLLMEANRGGKLPPTFSMNNANFLLPGERSTPISINPVGGPALLPNLNSGARGASMEDILDLPSSHLLEAFASSSFRNARDSSRLLSSAIAGSRAFGRVNSSNSLAVQLRMVARMISVRRELGMNRQIFFVGVGGWDTHKNQALRFTELTNNLNEGLTGFQQTLNTMGVENEVTTFTASDFGRTLTRNDTGSDHGWGGHNIVMGGAVEGGQLYGNWPDYALRGASDIGAGRILPELSINQYGAALGSWMGLSNGDLLDVFPDLNRFETGWRNQYGLFG